MKTQGMLRSGNPSKIPKPHECTYKTNTLKEDPEEGPALVF